MTTVSYSGTYSSVDGVVYTSITRTTEDEVDIAMMAEAERDFDEGRSAPVERVFANVRRERRERAAAGEATPAHP